MTGSLTSSEPVALSVGALAIMHSLRTGMREAQLDDVISAF
jgi:hypothetical protein